MEEKNENASLSEFKVAKQESRYDTDWYEGWNKSE